MPMPSIALDRPAAPRAQVRGNTTSEAVTLPVSSTAIAFDVGRGGHAFTVTLSDRMSGDVLLKLVYDHGGVIRPAKAAAQGQMIDISL